MVCVIYAIFFSTLFVLTAGYPYYILYGVFFFSSYFAFISIALGVINLFPIPVLDGGHLLFLLYEAVFKKPVPKKVWVVMNNFFALCLIVLMVVIVVNDIRFWDDRVHVLKAIE